MRIADAIRKSYGYGETAKLNRRIENKCNRVKQRTGLRMRSDWFTYKNVSFIDRAHNAYIFCVQKWRVSISRCVHDTHTHTHTIRNRNEIRRIHLIRMRHELQTIRIRILYCDRSQTSRVATIAFMWFCFHCSRSIGNGFGFRVVRFQSFVLCNWMDIPDVGYLREQKPHTHCRTESEWMWCGCSDRRDLW